MERCIALLYFLICLLPAANKAAGQIRIDSILVGGRALSASSRKDLQMAALDNDITFSFYSSIQPATRYRYILEGFEKNWVNSQYPVARYTNLPGGNYKFRVQNVPLMGVTGEAQFYFTKERALTEEWWFIPSVIFYVLALLGTLMYFFILYNFRQKLKVQSIRYRLAADLHDEVGATLSSISMAANIAQRKIGAEKEDIQSLLEHIRSDSEQTVHMIRDTVWTINPDNDSPEKLFEKMRSLAFQMLTVKHIDVHFENEIGETKGIKISVEQRRNLYLIFKEAVHNIARHSGASRAEIRITHSKAGLRWLIQDNGIGFDTNKSSNGNGLKNFRNRAQQSLIDLELTSLPGKGTRLMMTVTEV